MTTWGEAKNGKRSDYYIPPLYIDYHAINGTTNVVYWSSLSRGCASVCQNDTVGHIDSVASVAYKLTCDRGGSIPYTVVREFVENFLHAGFDEAAVVLCPDGDGIAFIDRGPGLASGIDPYTCKTSTADCELAKYIRGVGTGYSIIRDWVNEDGCRSFWYDDTRKHGYAAFLATSETGKRACKIIQAASMVADELDAPNRDAFVELPDEVCAAIVYVLLNDARCSREEIEKFCWGVIGATNGRDSLVDVMLGFAESNMKSDSLYREAVEASCKRVSASCNLA